MTDQTDIETESEMHFDMCIDEVLLIPITSRDEAERFITFWRYDGLGIPLHDEMFELRTVMTPQKFDELTKRVRELDDDADWYDYDAPEGWDPPGHLVRGIVDQLDYDELKSEREFEAAFKALDDIYQPAPIDNDFRMPLGHIGSEEDAPYTFAGEEGAPYEHWGADETSGDISDTQRDYD